MRHGNGKMIFQNGDVFSRISKSRNQKVGTNHICTHPIEDFFCSKLAKKNSIKNGKKLNSIEIKKLISDLNKKSKDLSFYNCNIFSFILKFEDIKKNIG